MIKKLISGTFVLVLAALIDRAVQIILVPIYTSIFNASEYGLIVISGNIASFTTILALLGTHSTLFYKQGNACSPRARYDVLKICVQFICLTHIIVLLIIITLIFLEDLVFKVLDAPVSLIISAILAQFFLVYHHYFSTYKHITKDFNWTLKFSILKNTGILLLSAVFLSQTSDIKTKFMIEIFAVLVVSLALVRPKGLTRPLKRGSNLLLVKNEFWTDLKYGMNLQLSQVALLIITISDKFIIAALRNTADVAVYNIIALAQIAIVGISSVINVVTVLYIENYRRNISNSQILTTVGLIGINVIGFYKILIEYNSVAIVNFFGGEYYTPYAELVKYNGDILICVLLYQISNRIFIANGNTKSVAWVMICCATINILWCLSGVSQYGIIWAIYGSIVSFIFAAICFNLIKFLKGFHDMSALQTTALFSNAVLWIVLV